MTLGLTDEKSTLVQVMAWCRQATSHYLIQCWPSSMLPFGVTRPQWVNLLGFCYTIWHHTSGSTFAPHNGLSFRHQAITQTNADLSTIERFEIYFHEIGTKCKHFVWVNVACKLVAILLRPQCVNYLSSDDTICRCNSLSLLVTYFAANHHMIFWRNFVNQDLKFKYENHFEYNPSATNELTTYRACPMWQFSSWCGWQQRQVVVSETLLSIQSLQASFNSLRPRPNGRHFPDDIFKWIFLKENVWILIKS